MKVSSEFDVRRRHCQCSDESITLHFYIHTVYLNLLPAAKGEMLKRIWKRRRRRRKLPIFEDEMPKFSEKFHFSLSFLNKINS